MQFSSSLTVEIPYRTHTATHSEATQTATSLDECSSHVAKPHEKKPSVLGAGEPHSYCLGRAVPLGGVAVMGRMILGQRPTSATDVEAKAPLQRSICAPPRSARLAHCRLSSIFRWTQRNFSRLG
ncbi:hypothetical protein VFPPC_17520 [Pochonia chlamydosporia 170]|uniref:Uncharacterized protein n=1 Tax=Pochonia chlamydosporia 170 TaxID=1380566 RepID=A0A219ARB2_METCM|nr:hypothetical protein VFPPC_17520 [Pochonia chlamydosporia 170]OWT43317.1 hypothetical protein VFPPC_17520 [Pochonia chlamydosporia 170]